MTPRPATPLPRATLRAVLLVLGWLCVGLGLLGLVLPVLPTTPFLLLAAACFARSSPRFHAWLLAHRTFGPLLRSWREHRALPPGVKARAIVLVALTFSLSITFGLSAPWHRAGLALVGVGLVVFLARLPVRAAAPPAAGLVAPLGPPAQPSVGSTQTLR